MTAFACVPLPATRAFHAAAVHGSVASTVSVGMRNGNALVRGGEDLMSWLCTVGFATCMTLAGNTLTYDDAEQALWVCNDSVSLPTSQFGMERGTFLGFTQNFSGAGLNAYDELIDLGFRQLRKKRSESPAERRFAFIDLCREIGRDFRAH